MDWDDRSLALVMWGDLFEDFFDTIEVSLETFRTELTGGGCSRTYERAPWMASRRR